MKTLHFTAPTLVFLLLAGCSGDSSSAPSGSNNNGGSGGSSGSSSGGSSGSSNGATGGSSGSSGAGAMSGNGGSSGSTAGTAGSAGNGGSQGGSSGNAGSSGTGNAGSGGSVGGQSGSGGSSGNAQCTSDTDCVDTVGTPLCNTSTGACVQCLLDNDTCPAGQYCNAANLSCTSGCSDDSDCSGNTPHCRPSTHQCAQCVLDTQCSSGEICVQGSCAQGCSDQQPCVNGNESCCGQSCHDLNADPTHCGGCDTACTSYANAETLCVNGSCTMGQCAAGFLDCNLDPSDGCEANSALLPNGQCVCNPGQTRSCYTAPLTAAQTNAGTANVGECKAGTQYCSDSGVGWEPCLDQVFPELESCDTSKDFDCDGINGNAPDIDGDGWTRCEGDCCELTSECAVPAEVNPGAFEFVGDGVDNDCDPASSDSTAPAACSTVQDFSAVTALQVAQAMDICQQTTANPAKPQKKWGLISAAYELANGTTPAGTALTDIQNKQTAIMTAFGTGGIVPQHGATMAGLSTGVMRDSNDSGYVGTSTSLTTSVQPPAVYLAAHGNALPSSAGCSGNCPAGSDANDSVAVVLTLRVPTNAKSLSYKFRFLSSEYWTYQCTIFNDFYLALLNTGAASLPADHNISFDANNNPVSVNNGFFDVCTPKGCNSCPAGSGALAGTGLESNGGATKWLKSFADVIPGETITLRFIIFDVSDHILDSQVILDQFEWGVNPSGVGTVEQ